MPDRVTTNEDSAISPATGKQIGRHEAAGLKGLAKDEHSKFWEEVTYWNNERFSEAKWQEVLKRIWRAKQEHGMIVMGGHPPPRPIHSIVTPEGRHVLLYSSSSLTAPTGAHPLRPAHLPRIETGSPTAPRPRWDVVPAGPATPLFATAGPVKNAFAQGGHWATLTPKTSSLAGTPTATTPTTAISLPFSPSSWTHCIPTDPAAKTAYEEARAEVGKMALQLCASRHALRRSFTAENDVIHPSMVRPRDTLLAAGLTLTSYKLPHSLSTYIDPFLPSKIEHYADEEAAGAKQYSIHTLDMLEDIDAWLRYDEKSGEVTTILEAQRDLLRMNRERRKGREVVVREGGVRLAWTTKVVDEIEAEVQRRKNIEGEDSDDEGYEYGNFVRSLGTRKSAETEEWTLSGSTLELTMSNSSTLDLSVTSSSIARSSGTASDMALAQRSASSSVKITHGFGAGHDSLPLRSRNFALSNLSSAAPSSGSYTHDDSYSDCYRPSYAPNNATSTHSIRRSNATTRSRHNLRIDTIGISASRESLLSPQERGTRRQGPSIQDLSSWADELKRMERKRAEPRLAVDEQNDAFPRARNPSVPREDTQHVHEENRQGHGIGNSLEAGLIINGCIHPALRGDGAGDRGGGGGRGKKRGRSRCATGSSTASWRCSTAAGIEQHTSDSSDLIDTVDYAYDNGPEHDDENGIYKHDDDDEDKYHDHNDECEYNDEDEDDDVTTPTPERMNRATHPLRSSSSPTHPPIRLSSLQSSLSTLYLSPPRRPPRPSSLLPHLPEPNLLLQAPGYNRHAATSYERQASRHGACPVSLAPRQQCGVGQRETSDGRKRSGVSKAALLEETMRSRGIQHTDADAVKE